MTESISNIIEKVKSGIVKITFYDNGEVVNSGSGFLCRDRLISNHHVFNPNVPLTNTIVGLRFGDSTADEDDLIKLPFEDCEKVLETSSTEDNFDYAVFSIKDIDYKKRYQFDLGDHKDIKEGSQILIMGYPFGEKNLTSHVGYVSSIYNDGKVDIIQLDASINSGNSGGPVVSLKTLKAVGLVTRKQTGLAKQFDELLKSFDENMQLFERLIRGGSVRIMGVDPLEYMKISQNQMKIISINIKRSANTGIGYALSCNKLKEEIFYAKP